jgi:hypothetical protein
MSTKSQALQQLGNSIIKSQGDKVLDICIAAQRNGANDLTRREIQFQWEQESGRRVEVSDVSRSVNGLVAASRLMVLLVPRPCSITGRMVQALQVPAVQSRLAY